MKSLFGHKEIYISTLPVKLLLLFVVFFFIKYISILGFD